MANMPFSDAEGTPTTLHVSGRDGSAFVAVGTDKGVVKAWDISRREPRQHTAGRRLNDGTLSRISSVQIASDGSRVSATLDVQVARRTRMPVYKEYVQCSSMLRHAQCTDATR